MQKTEREIVTFIQNPASQRWPLSPTWTYLTWQEWVSEMPVSECLPPHGGWLGSPGPRHNGPSGHRVKLACISRLGKEGPTESRPTGKREVPCP